MNINNNFHSIIKEKIEILYECLSIAPVDFLGTGDNSSFAEKEEKEWNDKWQSAYLILMNLLK